MDYLLTAGPFKVGDIINTGARALPRACIVCFRHANGNDHNSTQSLGADLLFEDGKVAFTFLQDITRWNPDFVAKIFSAGLSALPSGSA
jgi:hypothetical protein